MKKLLGCCLLMLLDLGILGLFVLWMYLMTQLDVSMMWGM